MALPLALLYAKKTRRTCVGRVGPQKAVSLGALQIDLIALALCRCASPCPSVSEPPCFRMYPPFWKTAQAQPASAAPRVPAAPCAFKLSDRGARLRLFTYSGLRPAVYESARRCTPER